MIITQFIRFIGIGTINTIITYILYLILLQIFTYQISYTITYIFGIFLSYILNLKFVFKEKGTKKKIVLFPLIYLFQYLFSISILNIIINIFNVSEKIAPILVIVITIPITFLFSKEILTKDTI